MNNCAIKTNSTNTSDDVNSEDDEEEVEAPLPRIDT